MPFQSQAQMRYMFAKHPGMAKRWEKETPKGKLPERKARVGKHPGFKKAAADIAQRQGVSSDRAAAILAAGARKASTGAVRRNPRLAKVKGKAIPPGKGRR